MMNLSLLSLSLAIAMGMHNDPAAASTKQIISLVEINDLHANLVTHKDLVLEDDDEGLQVEMRGGVARIATEINKIRKQNPNTLVMNIGDTYHGGAEAFYSAGNAIVNPVNALGIDVEIPGNWDFAYGPSIFFLRYTTMTKDELAQNGLPVPAINVLKPNHAILGGNVTFTIPTRAGQPVAPATMIKDINGVKVGLIGITSDIVPLQSSASAAGMAFLIGETAYKDYINSHAQELRDAGASIVVVMSELGIQKSKRLGDVINAGAVDVIFAAHTHELTKKPIVTTSGTLVVEPGNDTVLGRMDVTLLDGKVDKLKWKLINITEETPEDAAVAALVSAARAPFLNVTMPIPAPTFPAQQLRESIANVVGHTSTRLDRRFALESSFNNAYTDKVRAATGTQLALAPGFRYDAIVEAELDSVAVGEVTLEDIYRFFPSPFAMATATATGQRIRQLAEQGMAASFSTNVFNQNGGYLWGFAGLNATVNLAATDGARITALATDAGLPINADATPFSITGGVTPDRISNPSGYLYNQPGFANLQFYPNPATGSFWTNVDLLVSMLKAGQVLDGSRRSITDTNQTLFWPDADYIQPLEGVK